MTKGKRTAKKVFALLLSFIMVVCMMPGMAFADAAETTEPVASAVSCEVTITSQADQKFLHAPLIDTAVDANLAESYGYTDSVAASGSASVLDALVQAHIAKYGDAFTKEKSKEILSLDQAGNVTCFFGEQTTNSGVVINGQLSATTPGNTPIKQGDRLEFFRYASDEKDDMYIGFTGNYYSKENKNSIKKVSGNEDVLYCFGFNLEKYGISEESVRFDNAVDMVGMQLASVDAHTGEVTPIEGAVTGDYGLVRYTINQANGFCYLTAVSTEKNIIMPFITVEMVPKPSLKVLELYTGKDRTAKLTMTPELQDGKFDGYVATIPDTLTSVYIYSSFSTDPNAPTNVYWGEELTKKVSNKWGGSGNGDSAYIKDGYFSVCYEGTFGRVAEYKIKANIFATLKNLELEGIVDKAFASDETSYHSYIDPNAKTTTIKATGKSSSYTIKVNGAEIKNGEASAIPVIWDENGRMEVDIAVSSDKCAEHKYHITYEKEPATEIPTILLQPKSADYIIGEQAAALTTKASASSPVAYQWYKNSTNSKEGAIAIDGAQNREYMPSTNETGTTYYYCKFTNTGEEGKTATSDVVAVVVDPDPTPQAVLSNIGNELGDDYDYVWHKGFVYNAGATAEQISVSVKNPLEGATYHYEWRRTSASKNGETDTGGYYEQTGVTEITPYTDAKYANNEGYFWRCEVTADFKGKTYSSYATTGEKAEDGKDVTSVYVFIKANSAAAPSFINQPIGKDDLLVSNSTQRLNAYATADDGGEITYQWYENTENRNEGGELIEGATGDTYSAPLNQGGTFYYYCVATNNLQGKTASTASNTAKLIITDLKDVAEQKLTEAGIKGDGTEENPYEITSQADLEVVASLVKDGYSFENEYLKLTKDVDIDASWPGIGSINGSNAANGANLRPFSGTLDGSKSDGGNYTLTFAEGSKALLKYSREATVKNLNILAYYMDDYALLSNYIVDYGADGNYDGGTPATINVENVTLKEGSVIKKGGFLGGYASGLNICTFSNCTVEKNVKIGYDTTTNASSGVNSAGSFAGSVNGSFINCVSYADVYGNDYVGGIYGSKGQSMGPCSTSNCSFFGTIHATGDFVGGIAGAGYASESAPNSPCATIQNCSVAGSITGKNNVGGIFGGEPAVYQNWEDAYIRNNSFCGSLTATGENATVGGIVGYMASLNKYNAFENNYYCDDHAAKPIGNVKYIDTSYSSHEKDSLTEYMDTSVELPGKTGISKKDHNRTDDPLGKDVESLGKKVTAAEMADGTVANLLNQSDSSYKNWTTESGVPVHSSTPVVYELQLSGSYKTVYQVGDSLDNKGMTVTGLLTDGSTKEIPLSECKFSGFDSSKAGNPEITVSYGAAKAAYTVTVRYAQPENAPVTIRILGDAVHGEPTAETGTHTLSGGGLTTWVSESYTDFNQNNTVWDVIQKALADHNMTCSNPSRNYIESITRDGVTLAEFSNGDLSGWMYTLNGTHPELGVSEQFIKKGDVIVLHYTDDYTKEQGSEKWNTPVDETQPVIQDTTATVGKDNEAVSKLTASDVDKLIDAAAKQSAATIEVNVKGAEKADKVTLELPKASVSNISNKTDASLQVTTPQGIVTMDKQAMKEAVKAASGSDLTIALDKQEIADASKEPLGSAAAQTKVSILSGGKEIKDLGTAKVKILLPVSDAMKDRAMAAAAVDEDGKLTKTVGKLVNVNGKTYYQIETSKPGSFVVAESANIDAAIKAQASETDDEKLARIKKGVQNTTIKITKTSKGKGWIQIKWKKSKGYKVDYYEVFRKTGKNTKFGKKAFYKTKKHGMTGSYKNTKALKKGKRYYYKVRGVRVIDGKKYYTKWSRAYYRIAK